MVSDPNGPDFDCDREIRNYNGLMGFLLLFWGWDGDKGDKDYTLSPTHPYLLIFYCILVLWIISELFTNGEWLPGWFMLRFIVILIIYVIYRLSVSETSADNLSYLGSQKYL
jgi:hypothetical protein